jgi:flagella basal body P-ring formation protein FlgA
MSLRSLLLSACALWPVFAFAQQSGPASVTLELRANALVDHSHIALADVATVQGPGAETLAQLELTQAPRVGYVERLTRAQIEQAIRRRAGATQGAFVWSGAQVATVRTQAQTIRADDLAAAAMAAVQREFAAEQREISLTLATPVVDVDVPSGAVTLRARPLQTPALANRVALWVDVLVDGALYRNVVVQLAASVQQPAFVALHPMEQGAWAGPQDFAVRQAAVTGVSAVSATVPLTRFRVVQPLKPGQVLGSAAQAVSGRILRGDQVKLLIKSGQIGIETSAVAMADAGPGQMLAVRPAGGNEVVSGRVTQSGSVTIE